MRFYQLWAQLWELNKNIVHISVDYENWWAPFIVVKSTTLTAVWARGLLYLDKGKVLNVSHLCWFGLRLTWIQFNFLSRPPVARIVNFIQKFLVNITNFFFPNHFFHGLYYKVFNHLKDFSMIQNFTKVHNILKP